MAARRPFLVVSGNIGAGKSTVVDRVSEELGLEPFRGSGAANPFLTRFYGSGMREQAFHSQMFFLVEGVKAGRRIEERTHGVIQDRSVHEHFLVFAHELRDRELLSPDEFTVLSDLYYSVEPLLPQPDLLIHLDAPVELLLQRLAQRSAQIDPPLDQDYLSRLDRRYRDFLDSWYQSPVLRIDMAEYDVRDPEDLAAVAELIAEELLKVS